MRSQGSDERREATPDLERLHESSFPPADTNLRRLFELHRENRARQNRVIDTVVTYGAYEEPI